MANSLQFQWLHSPGTYHENGAIAQHERNYIDWIIDKESLSSILKIEAHSQVGNLGWGNNPTYETNYLQELLLEKPAELPTNRTMLYVCSECGDIGCGAITALISKSAQHYIWSDFAYENNYNAPCYLEYQDIGPFVFEMDEYARLINTIKEKLEL
jgi:hypothetical protein